MLIQTQIALCDEQIPILDAGETFEREWGHVVIKSQVKHNASSKVQKKKTNLTHKMKKPHFIFYNTFQWETYQDIQIY